MAEREDASVQFKVQYRPDAPGWAFLILEWNYRGNSYRREMFALSPQNVVSFK